MIVGLLLVGLGIGVSTKHARRFLRNKYQFIAARTFSPSGVRIDGTIHTHSLNRPLYEDPSRIGLRIDLTFELTSSETVKLHGAKVLVEDKNGKIWDRVAYNFYPIHLFPNSLHWGDLTAYIDDFSIISFSGLSVVFYGDNGVEKTVRMGA